MGDFVELAVHDAGSGVMPEHADRIFEPFFTTKQVGKGNGMGVSVVHGIVRKYGAHILLESSPGAGTAFRALLPAVSAVPQGKGSRAAAGYAGRKIGHASLRARELFAAQALDFDIVVLDQTMPRITGLELSKHLLAVRPDVAIFLYTGLSETLSTEQLKSAGVHALVRKPVDAAVLFEIMRGLLGRAPD